MEAQDNKIIEENKGCWLFDTCDKTNCSTFCLKRFKLNYLYEVALLPIAKRKRLPLYPDADGTDEQVFSKLKPELEDKIVDLVKNGTNFYIFSQQCGNGKTSIAIRLLQAYLNSIWEYSNLECRALFISVPRFLLELKASIKNKSDYIEHIKTNVQNCDLVIWDDIGEKAATEFESTNLYSIIDNRLLQNKANIFTSNLQPNELQAVLGDRLTSRIIYESINIKLSGKDKRGIKLFGEK